MLRQKSIVNPAVLVTLMLAGIWMGCNKNDSAMNPTPDVVAGPSNLRAYSVDATTVGLVWSLSPDESKSDLLSYQLTTRDTAGNYLSTQTLVRDQGSATVMGLQEGIVYIFTLKALVVAGAVTNDSSTVRWSPAMRLETERSLPIEVFETAADPNHPSGLDVYSATDGGPVTRGLTTAGNNLIDLFVATLTGSSDLEIRSASLSNVIPTPRITTFSDSVSLTNDLSDDAHTAPPPSSSFSRLSVVVPSSVTTTGRIYWGQTNDGNYFRLLVASNGLSLIFGPTGQRFIVVKLSYQRVVGNPCARPISTHFRQGQF